MRRRKQPRTPGAPAPPLARAGPATGVHAILVLLLFLCGITSLMYEVLWLKELGNLFGSTAHATATTLTVFFAGLGLGGYVWGRRAPRARDLLRTYALLELGIGLSAISWYFIMDLYAAVYRPLFSAAGHGLWAITGLRFLLALGLLFPPAFLMGGTLPVMGQLLIRSRGAFGPTATLLYGVNTLGAALGAFVAGFHLPIVLGFRRSYAIAIALNGVMAAAAFILSRRAPPAEAARPAYAGGPAPTPGGGGTPAGRFAFLVFLSGFITLGLEVLWTRMFSQVLANDVYSFAAILVTFLVALALGSFLARRLGRLRADPWTVLRGLAVASGMTVGLSAFVFYQWTGGLRPLQAAGWTGYVLALFAMAAGVMLIPAIAAGGVFPWLLVMAAGSPRPAGETLGLWTSVNTAGAITGSLVAGFVLPELLGLWSSIGLMGGLYFGATVLAARDVSWRPASRRAVPALAAAILCCVLPARTLAPTRLLERNRETLEQVWHGGDGIVSVVSARPPHYPPGHPGDLFIRLNNHYTLGGTGALADERRQAHLALLLHPDPRSVFFLGMGTGITAGAALYHPVERVVVTELVPDVVRAAEAWYTPHVNGLFADPRATIVVEDGRNYLRAATERYDVVIADLFSPWASRAGSLYALEHFRSVADRLEPGGVFVQWLPLDQLSAREFGTIARTLLEVFPQVTLWRGNFTPRDPVVALVTATAAHPLDPATLTEGVAALGRRPDGEELLIDALVNVKGAAATTLDPQRRDLAASILPHLARSVPFTLYAGNIGRAADLFADHPVNSDDRPVIEFTAPRTRGRQRGGTVSWLTGRELERFFETLFEKVPPERDPCLQRLSPDQLGFVRAGLSYYRHCLHLDEAGAPGDADHLRESERWFNDYLERIGLRRPPSGP